MAFLRRDFRDGASGTTLNCTECGEVSHITLTQSLEPDRDLLTLPYETLSIRDTLLKRVQLF